MLWNPVALACGLTFSVMMGLIFVSSVRRSSFGWLIISVEYFYVLGLGLFPLLLSLGIIENPELLADYELKNGELRIATFVHIFLYGLGALHGYFFARQVAKKVSQRVVRIALANNINNYGWFYFLSGLTIVFSVLHFSFVGLDTALLNVAFARSGDFSGLVGFEQYQFLKNLAMLGLYSIVFVPYIIIDGKHILSAFVIVAVVATFIYLQTAARV